MKILKLLNKVNLLIIIIFFFILIHKANTNEPVDIWNIDSKKNAEESNIINNDISGNDLEEGVYEQQIENQNILVIEQDETLISKNIKIAGLYDPSENDLNINMWSNSDGNKILDIYQRIEKYFCFYYKFLEYSYSLTFLKYSNF